MASVLEHPAQKEKVVQQPKVKNAGTVNWLQASVHRGRNEIFSDVKTVTPGLAEVLLSNNPSNRTIRKAKLRQFVADMKNDRWSLNGEAIIVAKTGELNDGQNRLQAVIESNVCVPMLFVFGVERETRTTLDQGGARGAADYLHMSGRSNASVLSSMTRVLLGYERTGCTSLGRLNDITPAEIVQRAEEDQMKLQTSARFANQYARSMRRMAPVSTLAFCHYVLLGEHVHDGLSFMEQLCSGQLLERGDPAFTARERLLSLDSLSPPSRVEIIFRAYNAYREKRTMKTIPIHGRLPDLV